jgi:DNA polymerase sigma
VQFTTLPEFGEMSFVYKLGFDADTCTGAYDIDIGINNTDGLTGVEVINGFMEKFPALKPLVLVLKGMLKQRKLGDAAFSGLGSYSTTLMCISFLQVRTNTLASVYTDRPHYSLTLASETKRTLTTPSTENPLEDSSWTS